MSRRCAALWIVLATLVAGCAPAPTPAPTPAQETPTAAAAVASPTPPPSAEMIAQYEAAFAAFFEHGNVKDMLSPRLLVEPKLYVDPNFNDGTGAAPAELLALLEPHLAAAQLQRVAEESQATLTVSSTAQVPAKELPTDGFAGPTIIIMLHVMDKSGQNFGRSFGLGYTLTPEGDGWRPEQYLLITS